MLTAPFSSHPLIPNAQEHVYYKKFVSIHSEDRNVSKFPNAAEFEVELPTDITDILSVRLSSWTFPSNYDTFSRASGNISMTFQISDPYNPAAHDVSNNNLQQVYAVLADVYATGVSFVLQIESGFYSPDQMVTELARKMNAVVSAAVIAGLQQRGQTAALDAFVAAGGYTHFQVAYHAVNQKIWFGNQSDGFVLTNAISLQTAAATVNGRTACRSSSSVEMPEFADWGLPDYLGLPRTNVTSGFNAETASVSVYNGQPVPRFFYGDVVPGDQGFWLLPDPAYPGNQVQWMECAAKINLMGDAYLYMDVDGLDCIDETSPYSVSTFTQTTNQTAGRVNSALAKMSIPCTPLSQWFDRDSVPYKLFYPPAERIRRVRVRVRYHNGRLATFGAFNYSFMLEFTVQAPHILRTTKGVVYPPSFGR